MPLSEQEAIASCQAGNLQDFDLLYTQFVDRIYAYIYRRIHDRQTTEDLTSTTFLKALEKISTFKAGKAPFSAWLYRIARNTIIDYYRTHRETAELSDVWELPSSEDRPDEVTSKVVDVDAIKKALQGLPPLKREILLLRLWEGLSFQEIAVITGETEGNCKVIASRTLAALKTQLHPLLFLLLSHSIFQ